MLLTTLFTLALWSQPVQEPVTTTGYCGHKPCTDYTHGITKSGTRVQVGSCAGDWRVLPKFSYWYVPGYGICRVEDTGRLVKGRHLDLYFDDIRDARQWGRKTQHIRRIMMIETPESVGEWAVKQFGKPTPLAVLRRMCDEVLEGMELCVVKSEATRTMFKAFRVGLGYLDKYAHTPEDQLRLAEPIAEELADATIVGYHAASILGVVMFDEIDRKMDINRRRKWKSNGDGTGQHVDEDIVMRGVDEEEEDTLS